MKHENQHHESGDGDLVQCFKNEWKRALEGDVPPRLDDYLSRVDGPESGAVRKELASVHADFSAAWSRTRSQQADQTVENDVAAAQRGDDTMVSEAGSSTDSVSKREHGLPTGLVGQFELIEEIGRGGMGVVFKARDRKANRVVAVKMMLAGQFASEIAIRRFRIEAEAAANLDHSNIVPIFYVGEFEDLPYFAMKFVKGTGLDCLDHSHFASSPRAAAELVYKMALAVQYAHRRGILHRDLKPANILIDEAGEPLITDFGLAKWLNDDTNDTRTGAVVGTPDYMSPEQAMGLTKKISVATDVYSLGSILFDLLTGEPPFRSATVMQTLSRVSEEPARAPAQLNRRVGPDLETICLKCLEKEPEKRYPSARDLAEELERYLNGEPIKARPVGRVERLRRWCIRNPLVASLTTVVFVLLLAWLVMLNLTLVEIRQQRDGARAARDLARYNEAQAHKMAHTIVNKFQDELRDHPGLRGLRQEALKIALDGLEDMDAETFSDGMDEVTRQFGKDAGSQFLGLRALAGAHQRGGGILMELGYPRQALEKFQQALALTTQMDQEVPDHPLCKLNLAAAANNVADAYRRLGKFDLTLANYERGLKSRQQRAELIANLPGVNKWYLVGAKWSVAFSHVLVSDTHLALGQPQQARDEMRKAVPWRAAVPLGAPLDKQHEYLEMAMYESTLGEVHLRFSGVTEALKAYEKSRRLLRGGIDALGKQGKGRRLQRRLVRQHVIIGDAQFRAADDLQAAESEYRSALELGLQLRELDPNNAQTAALLAKVYYGLGVIQSSRSRDEGRESFEQALELLEQLAEDSPDDALIQADLMMTLARLGHVDDAVGMIELIRSKFEFPRAVASLLAARCYSVCAAHLATSNDPSADDETGPMAKALQQLESALEQGWRDYQLVETHPDLEFLRQRYVSRVRQLLDVKDDRPAA